MRTNTEPQAATLGGLTATAVHFLKLRRENIRDAGLVFRAARNRKAGPTTDAMWSAAWELERHAFAYDHHIAHGGGLLCLTPEGAR